LTLRLHSLKEGKKCRERAFFYPTPDSDRLIETFLRKIAQICQANSPQVPVTDSSSRKRGQLFIRTHNETLSVVPMRTSAMKVVRPRENPQLIDDPDRWQSR
jgi:hypothetical protein